MHAETVANQERVTLHCGKMGDVYGMGQSQRREDMMPCRSDNLHALITLQGQES